MSSHVKLLNSSVNEIDPNANIHHVESQLGLNGNVHESNANTASKTQSRVHGKKNLSIHMVSIHVLQ